MDVILDEKEWVENAIKNRDLGERPGRTLCRLARYYYQEGLKKKEIREKLTLIVNECDFKMNDVKRNEYIEFAVKLANKRNLVRIKELGITSLELETIAALPEKPMRKLAFTLLCLAKYQNSVSADNPGWVKTNGSSIMRIANVNADVKRQSALIKGLRDSGLLLFAKRVDSLSVRVMFIDGAGKPVLWINDFRNLGNQYLMYCGEKYFRCDECGAVVKRNSNTQRYCRDCAPTVYVRNKMESAMLRVGV